MFATGVVSNSDAMSVMSNDGDWQIDSAEIVIVKRADGTDWMLGDGAFGQVRPLALQPAACLIGTLTGRECRHRTII